MTAFVICAGLLVVAVVAIVLRPLWRAPRAAPPAGARSAANLAIFRDQLAELERERSAGTLSEADFAQAKTELQRRLLDEVDPAQALADTGGPAPGVASAPAGSERKTALALLLVLPLAAAAGYAVLGNPRALDPLARQANPAPEQVAEMVNNLARKLQKNPDDARGWLMLARSYKVLERYTEAAEAYGRAAVLVDADANLLADYAEVLSAASGGSLRGKPSELLERALKLDPDAPQALLMAGAAAHERHDFAAAASYWTRLQAQVEADSADGQALAGAIAQVRELAQAAGGSAARSAIDRSKAISGEVTLSGKLAGKAAPQDVLFVFARPEDGSRMPLAATRATVADLPLRFSFDDSMALAGGRKLSDFKAVHVEARIVKAGQAQASPGDLFGALSGVRPGSRDLRLLIDQVQP